MSDSTDLSRLYEAILKGDAKTAVEVVKAAPAKTSSPADGVRANDSGHGRGRDAVSSATSIFVPELLIAARAMKSALELLTPLLAEAGIEAVGRVVIGTVKGDLHDIGKNLVASMLEGGGFEVVDLGVDVPPEKFVEAAQEAERATSSPFPPC